MEDDLGIRIDPPSVDAEKGKDGDDVRTLYDEQVGAPRVAGSGSGIVHALVRPRSPKHAPHLEAHAKTRWGPMQIWMRKHSLSDSDRVVHELRTLVDSLYLAGVYDQLNLGSLSCLKCVSRRIQTILEAFSNSAGPTPDWSRARLYTGQATADDVVSPDLRSWAATKGKEEVELHQARTKIREARKLGTETAETRDGAGEGLAPAPLRR